MELNEKVAEILKEHPEGEDFFNTLDMMIKGDNDILDSFMAFFKLHVDRIVSPPKNRIGIILSGEFGHIIANNYMKDFSEFGEVIIVNGGIRTGKEVNLYKTNLKCSSYIFLDDSYYSGLTKESIQEALTKIDENVLITHTFVVYDGGKEVQDAPFSMYRYYDKHKQR